MGELFMMGFFMLQKFKSAARYVFCLYSFFENGRDAFFK